MLLSVHKAYSKDNNNTFITVLRGSTPATTNPDGLPVAGRQVTYRIKLTQLLPIGKQVNINLDNYTLSHSETVDTETGEIITYKWLNPKA